MNDEPFVEQMYIMQLNLDEFFAVMGVYGQYCNQIWYTNGFCNIQFINVPLMILGPLADTIRSVTAPEEVGEPTHE